MGIERDYFMDTILKGKKKTNRDCVLNIYYVIGTKSACCESFHLIFTQPCEIRVVIPI